MRSTKARQMPHDILPIRKIKCGRLSQGSGVAPVRAPNFHEKAANVYGTWIEESTRQATYSFIKRSDYEFNHEF
jgi:hypothetical protein